MDIKIAVVTEVVEDKVKVRFNQDDTASLLEYPKLISYKPNTGDQVLMLKTNTSYICLGGIGTEAEDAKTDGNMLGEYKFFAKDKGLEWDGWLKCDGREISRNAYSDLFTEIGTTFGAGNGGSTFNLPNSIGRVLSDATGKTLGEKAGTDTVTLTANQIPNHSHDIKIGTEPFTGTYHTRLALAANNSSSSIQKDVVQSTTNGGSAHENRQPTLYGGYYYIYSGVK